MYRTCPELSTLPTIRHGFFTRRGGASTGLYSSLNCGYGSGDDMTVVEANRQTVADALEAQALCTAFQIHSPNVVTLDRPWHWRDAPEADALVTKTPDVAIGILTADCLPILWADATHGVIGATHAGWKGAFGGIIEATLSAMVALGARAETITASIGPAIAQMSYEVRADFYQRFIDQDERNSAYFVEGARAGHYQFDLKGYAKSRLLSAGVSHLEVMADDTCAQEDDFYSFRRATLNTERVYGRQISAIMLKHCVK